MEQSRAPFFLKNFSLSYAKLPIPPTSPKEAKLSSANIHGTMSIGDAEGPWESHFQANATGDLRTSDLDNRQTQNK